MENYYCTPEQLNSARRQLSARIVAAAAAEEAQREAAAAVAAAAVAAAALEAAAEREAVLRFLIGIGVDTHTYRLATK
eukprot:COSAG01_NODE_891_length_12911_cov_99.327740_1_plen_78_part_00